jgi:hypothetical protein
VVNKSIVNGFINQLITGGGQGGYREDYIFDPAFGRQTFQVHVRVTVFSWTASQTLAWIIPFMQAKSKPLVFE